VRYSVVVRKPDGLEVSHLVSSYDGDQRALEIARTIAESYGAGSEVADVVDADGRNVMPDQKDPIERESQKPDDQNKTATERVDKQSIDTKEVTPNKTGDIRPNR
jgi:hypothetical protein